MIERRRAVLVIVLVVVGEDVNTAVQSSTFIVAGWTLRQTCRFGSMFVSWQLSATK